MRVMCLTLEEDILRPLRSRIMQWEVLLSDDKEGILFCGDELCMPFGKALNGSVEHVHKLLMKLWNRKEEIKTSLWRSWQGGDCHYRKASGKYGIYYGRT